MKTSKYISKQPNSQGFIDYTTEEHEVWQILLDRQLKLVKQRACNEYLQGIEELNLPNGEIPQLPHLDKILQQATGWQTEAVPCLIDFEKFFELLANKKFPVATFIRTKEDLDYLQEPDIFHEVFGHCPLLTNASFAKFTETYGKLGLAASKQERIYLARLYWLTVEFGLLQTDAGVKIYGGGILSSHEETLHCLDNTHVVRKNFDLMQVLKTPYKINILQPIYYIINQLSDLDTLCEMDLMHYVHQAMQEPLLEPLYQAANQ